jgi:acetolactate synthase I/III small subunit
MSTGTLKSHQLTHAGGIQATLELTVNNHPGVMSHICSLFARRLYNVEAILCVPIGSGVQSRIWLLVHADHRLEQMIKQVGKLEDVHSIQRHSANPEVFVHLEKLFRT